MGKKKDYKLLWLLGLLILVLLGGMIFFAVLYARAQGSTTNFYSTTTTTTNELAPPVQPKQEDPVLPPPVMIPAEDEGFDFPDWMVPDLFFPEEEEPAIIANPAVITPQIITPCTDSDAMSAQSPYFVAGSVTVGDVTYLDICPTGTMMKENSCSSTGKLVETTVDCADYGRVCKFIGGKGYCAPTTPCTDSDGGDEIFVKGTCTSENAGTTTDVCRSSTALVEYNCRNNECASLTRECPDTCGNGACTGLA